LYGLALAPLRRWLYALPVTTATGSRRLVAQRVVECDGRKMGDAANEG
jgi:hypothetical protein